MKIHHDIGAANQDANDYWKSVGGHPLAGHMDVPEHYTCWDCPNAGTPYNDDSVILAEKAEEAGWAECPDCEEWFCPKHLVPDERGHEELCMACADERTQARLTPTGGMTL